MNAPAAPAAAEDFAPARMYLVATPIGGCLLGFDSSRVVRIEHAAPGSEPEPIDVAPLLGLSRPEGPRYALELAAGGGRLLVGERVAVLRRFQVRVGGLPSFLEGLHAVTSLFAWEDRLGFVIDVDLLLGPTERAP